MRYCYCCKLSKKDKYPCDSCSKYSCDECIEYYKCNCNICKINDMNKIGEFNGKFLSDIMCKKCYNEYIKAGHDLKKD